MTTQQAVEKWGVSKTSVKQWLRDGLIPGARKVKIRNSMTWILPNDAVPPPKGSNCGRKRGIPNSDVPQAPKGRMSKEKFIMLHSGTKSTRGIAQALGISTAEVRAIYDRIYMKNNN